MGLKLFDKLLSAQEQPDWLSRFHEENDNISHRFKHAIVEYSRRDVQEKQKGKIRKKVNHRKR